MIGNNGKLNNNFNVNAVEFIPSKLLPINEIETMAANKDNIVDISSVNQDRKSQNDEIGNNYDGGNMIKFVGVGKSNNIQYGYEPNNKYRAKGNIKIEAIFTREIIPKRIEQKISNIFHFMDKYTAIIFGDGQYVDLGDVKIMNYGFKEKTTLQPLYCILRKHFETNWVIWKMENELFTKDRLQKEFDCQTVPICPRDLFPKKQVNYHLNKIKSQFSRNPKIIEQIAKYTAWHKLPIKARTYNKKRITLAMTKEEFIDNLTQFVNTKNNDNNNNNNNKYNFIPILTFNSESNKYRIELVWIVRIDNGTDVGIALTLNNENETLHVCGIHLDETYIHNQHELCCNKLEENEFKCNCMDLWQSRINMLTIGNPDVDKNRSKDYRKKLDDLKRKNLNITNENQRLKQENERLKKLLSKYMNESPSNSLTTPTPPQSDASHDIL